MKTASWLVGVCVWLLLGSGAQADFFRVASPDHGQTFAYGSEANRVLAERGRDRHLVVQINYTNDPFVDRNNPREYDSFTFSFRDVTLGHDGHTFCYRTPKGRVIPVADKQAGFLGINQIRLLPNAVLIVSKPHGYVTVVLEIEG